MHLGRALLFLICMSFRREMIFLLSCSFLDPWFNVVMVLPTLSCLPSSSSDHQCYLLPPFLTTTMLLSTERSSIFINPEEYPNDIKEFIIFFHTSLTKFLVSLPDCLVGTVLSRYVHPPRHSLIRTQHAMMMQLLSSALGLPIKAWRGIEGTKSFQR
jgi:hypothetical protein